MLPIQDLSDSANSAKYRPIACLQKIYNIITSCLSETIYEHNTLAEEQKWCRQNSQGCKEQLTIDAVASKKSHKGNAIFTQYT